MRYLLKRDEDGGILVEQYSFPNHIDLTYNPDDHKFYITQGEPWNVKHIFSAASNRGWANAVNRAKRLSTKEPSNVSI